VIILDYNAISLSNIITQRVDIKEDFIRHMILNSIRMYRTKFKNEYGEIVIAADGANSWRRSYYPQYKAKRRTQRDDNFMDWGEAFRVLNLVREELKESFPYKVVHIEGCEADDVIGTLVENTMDFGNYENVMIVSSDKDFLQLQKYEHVKQYSPMKKRVITEPNARHYLAEHILKGDTADGIPNVLSDDNCFVDGTRQTPLKQKKIDEILRDLDDGELLYAASWYRNYCRNKKLIDLTETPEDLKEKIIYNYNDQDVWNNKGKVFPYLVEKECTLLLESVQEFI